MPVNEDALAGSHFNHRQLVVCRLIVKIVKANQLLLLNVGFDARGRQASTGDRRRIWDRHGRHPLEPENQGTGLGEGIVVTQDFR